jgi:hypothetical protein
MQEKDEVVRLLFGQSLRSCKEYYDNFEKSFAALDTKAQYTITVAGVFIGAIFAFLKAENLNAYPVLRQWTGAAFLGASTAALMGSVMACVIGMFVRRVPPGLTAGTLSEIANDLDRSDLSAPVTRLHIGILKTQISIWKGVLGEISKKVHRKATAIAVGQSLLAASIALVGILVLLIIKGQ